MVYRGSTGPVHNLHQQAEHHNFISLSHIYSVFFIFLIQLSWNSKTLPFLLLLRMQQVTLTISAKNRMPKIKVEIQNSSADMSLKQIHTPHIYICSISRIVRFEIFNKSSIYSNAIYPDISDTISIQISGYLGTKCAIYSNTIYPDISDTIYPASISDQIQCKWMNSPRRRVCLEKLSSMVRSI